MIEASSHHPISHTPSHTRRDVLTKKGTPLSHFTVDKQLSYLFTPSSLWFVSISRTSLALRVGVPSATRYHLSSRRAGSIKMTTLRDGLEASIRLASFGCAAFKFSSVSLKDRPAIIAKLSMADAFKTLLNASAPQVSAYALSRIPPLNELSKSVAPSEADRIRNELYQWFNPDEANKNIIWPYIRDRLLPYVTNFPPSFGIVGKLDDQSFIQFPYAVVNSVGISLPTLPQGGDGDFPVLLPGIIPFGRSVFGFSALISAIHINPFLSSLYTATPERAQDLPIRVAVWQTVVPFVISPAHEDKVIISGCAIVFSSQIKYSAVDNASIAVVKCMLLLSAHTDVARNAQAVHVELVLEDAFDSLDDVLISFIDKRRKGAALASPLWLHYSLYAEKVNFDRVAERLKAYATKAVPRSSVQRPVGAPFMTDAIDASQQRSSNSNTLSLFDI